LVWFELHDISQEKILNITAENVNQFVKDGTNLNVVQLLNTNSYGEIYSGNRNLVGNILPFSNVTAPAHTLQKNFCIVSRNCNFNSFRGTFGWLQFANDLFFDGVYMVCLQDVPYKFIKDFTNVGHIAYICYGVGDNKDLVCNLLIFNRKFISYEMLVELRFGFIPEVEATSNSFVAGCFYTQLSYSDSFCECVIGSVYDSFASSVFLRRVNWERRFNWMKLVSEHSSLDSIFVGDFNPRTQSKLTDERPMVKTGWKKLNNFVYLIRLIPFVLLSLIGNTARKELLSFSSIGVITPEFTTMKSRKLLGFIPLDTAKLQWTVDAVQTTVSPTKVMITRLHQDNLSDYFGLFVSIQT
jgi:hypothetical protein